MVSSDLDHTPKVKTNGQLQRSSWRKALRQRGRHAVVVAELAVRLVRLVTESMPHVRFGPAGVWVTRDPVMSPDAESGIAQFIEHMLSRGTTTRRPGTAPRPIDFDRRSAGPFTARARELHIKCSTSTANSQGNVERHGAAPALAR